MACEIFNATSLTQFGFSMNKLCLFYLEHLYKTSQIPYIPQGLSFFFFTRLVLSATTASITIGLDLHQRRLLLHEVIGPRYHGMCHV